VNQFGKGVTPGVNGGGPDPAGYRNIINLDRGDAGYSPLWNIWWAVTMPINYMVDEFSNAQQGTMENGFEFFVTPMYVNCPDIGPIGVDTNALKATEFETMIDLGMMMTDTMDTDQDGYVVMGSAPTLIFQPDVEIVFMTDTGVDVGMTTTNIMGAYTYMIPKSDIDEDVMMIKVMTTGDDAMVLRMINVTSGGEEMDDGNMVDGGSSMMSSAPSTIVASGFAAVISMTVVVVLSAVIV
jgi:hypothetical protein